MMKALLASGVFFAISAALLNSTIALISKILLTELPPELIAFYKSLIGASVLWIFLRKSSSTRNIRAVLLCSFLGIFCLFYFETRAYAYEIAPNVVFTMMGSAAISAFLLDLATGREHAGWVNIGGLGFCLLGLALLLDISQPQRTQGVILASIAGTGYGLFSTFAKSMQLGGGLAVTRALLTCGSFYLLFPAWHTGLVIPSADGFVLLAMLALLPSILGFYCTTKAIELTTPTKVQICELSEPGFVLVLSAIFLGELPTAKMLAGAASILAGIYVTNLPKAMAKK